MADKLVAPAVYTGRQAGYGTIPAMELWMLTADIPGHCAGSTLESGTLLAAGYALPEKGQDNGNRTMD